MPKRLSRKKIRKLSKRYSNKRGGMFKAAKKLAKSAFNRRSFKQKLQDDINGLLKSYLTFGKKKEKESQQKKYTAYILNEGVETEFKNELYNISERINMLKLEDKPFFLKIFKQNLVFILGDKADSQRAIEKIVNPILLGLENNADLASAFADLEVSNTQKAHNKALRNVSSRLRKTNGAAAAFLDPMLNTRTTNNGWEEVQRRRAHPGATNVNQNEVSELMEQMQNEALLELEQNLPSAPTTILGSKKGGYRKIKKSRKRVYA